MRTARDPTPAGALANYFGVQKTGYARLATLGEEVIDPATTIPRAIPLALGTTLVIYAAVAVSALGRRQARRKRLSSSRVLR